LSCSGDYPALSLVLSMTLRFVPKFTSQIKVVSEAQRCVGRDVSEGSILQRARNGLTILSIMVTWSLENAIETADSMKSRGYGLPGRTVFHLPLRQPGQDRPSVAAVLRRIYHLRLGCGRRVLALLPHHAGRCAGAFSRQLYAGLSCPLPYAGHTEHERGSDLGAAWKG
jgi:hypothetical protein